MSHPKICKKELEVGEAGKRISCGNGDFEGRPVLGCSG
jgi:hypothetical protein